MDARQRVPRQQHHQLARSYVKYLGCGRRIAESVTGQGSVTWSKDMQFNWSPRIGDPTVGGWLTVILYVLASVSCWRAARKVGTRDIYLARATRVAVHISFILGFGDQQATRSAKCIDRGGSGRRQHPRVVCATRTGSTRLYRCGCDHLYDRRDCFGDLGAASTASGALGSNRYNTRSLLCVGPSGILPPRGPFY